MMPDLNGAKFTLEVPYTQRKPPQEKITHFLGISIAETSLET